MQLAHVIVIELASSLSPLSRCHAASGRWSQRWQRLMPHPAGSQAVAAVATCDCLFASPLLLPQLFFFFCARFKGNLGAVNKFWHLIIFCGFVRRIYLCVPQWRRLQHFRLFLSGGGGLASGGSALSQRPLSSVGVPTKCANLRYFKCDNNNNNNNYKATTTTLPNYAFSLCYL